MRSPSPLVKLDIKIISCLHCGATFGVSRPEPDPFCRLVHRYTYYKEKKKKDPKGPVDLDKILMPTNRFRTKF